MSRRRPATVVAPMPGGETWVGRIVDSRSDILAAALVALTAVMALLLFNARMSEGGDDSSYICRALDFLADGKYPDYQGPLYPLFLAPFIALGGGVSVVGLKFTSYALVVAGQAAMWLALRHCVSRRLLLSVMLLMACNLWFVQFGSLTYSEPLFIVLEWLFAWGALRLEGASSRRGVALFGLLVGAVVVLASLVRTAGLGLGVAGVVFLLLRRRWAGALSVVASVAVVFGLWMALRSAVWGPVKADDRQLQSLLQVDPYDPADGMETPRGFALRFAGNSKLYVSKHYVKMLGLRDPASRSTSAPATVLLYGLFGWGAWVALRRNRGVLLIAVTAATMLGLTFFSLQTLWDQYRLILPYVAMMHIVVLYAVADIVRRLARRHRMKIMACVVGVVSALLFSRAVGEADLLTLRKNLTTDQLAGYTPDWRHYLSLCRAVGEQMPGDDAYVACRKPNMARIYAGGKKFYGIYTIPSSDPDELVARLRDRGVTHIVVGSLRRDPAQAGLGVINTIHRYLGFILQKYPAFLEQVAVAGDERDEPAALYKLHYENATPDA